MRSPFAGPVLRMTLCHSHVRRRTSGWDKFACGVVAAERTQSTGSATASPYEARGGLTKLGRFVMLRPTDPGWDPVTIS
jgi:hypothetical protein